jgi:hypothetical protein
VRLPNDLIAKCDAFAAEIVAHYSSGDPMQALPWGAGHLMTLECECKCTCPIFFKHNS